MAGQHRSTPTVARDDTSAGPAFTVAPDVACLRVAIVNVYLVGPADAGDRNWVLVDAGIPGAAGRIRRAAAHRFGSDARPAAIVLTHAHFDHVGALEELAAEWDAPVYVHPLEEPYVTGRASYPPPDPTVGGGAIARLSSLFPRRPCDVSGRVRALPGDHTLPALPGWRWLHTPGHAPGHVSLFRDADRVLIAGDAVTTTKQESMLAALTQAPELHGPPMYFTHDWDRARHSVEVLAGLEPAVLATGHGRPLQGSDVAEGLRALALNFDLVARPLHGRYVGDPALFDVGGVVSVPPPVADPFPRMVAALGLAALAGVAIAALRRRDGDGDAAAATRRRTSSSDLREVALARLGSSAEDQQHVPVASQQRTPESPSSPPISSGLLPTASVNTSTGRPFDYGADASAPGDIPGGP